MRETIRIVIIDFGLSCPTRSGPCVSRAQECARRIKSSKDYIVTTLLLGIVTRIDSKFHFVRIEKSYHHFFLGNNTENAIQQKERT